VIHIRGSTSRNKEGLTGGLETARGGKLEGKVADRELNWIKETNQDAAHFPTRLELFYT